MRESLLVLSAAAADPLWTPRSKPDPEKAIAASVLLASVRGVTPRLSPRNVVEAQMEPGRVEETFQVQLHRVEPDTRSLSLSLAAGELLLPDRELTVPEALADTIAFAYVPTPPEFADISFVPPSAKVYHLRLEDVVRVFGGGRCHRRGWTGRGVRVAMVDSGFARHPYFEQQGYNLQRVPTPSAPQPASDTEGHGTGECANLLALAPDCNFFGIQNNNSSAEALETAVAQGVRVLTCSWGWNVDHQSMDSLHQDNPNLYNEFQEVGQILTEATAAGVTVIFAAGNEHRFFPACMPGVLSIGGVTVQRDGSLKASSYASSYVSQLYPDRQVPDVCGVVGEGGPSPQKGHIMLPVPNGSKLEGTNLPAQQAVEGWGIFSGTSAATPQVAGIVALMLSINPDLTPGEIGRILADTARDVTQGTTALGDTAQPGPDLATGAGFVDAFRACLRVEQLLADRPS